MIYGTGVDIIDIGRVKKLMGRHAVLGRIYGDEELILLAAKGSVQSYAANFCAKEAFAKALGTGVHGFSLSEVQLLRGEAGSPYLKLSGSAEKLASDKGLVFHISVTHTGTLAAAFVVAERAD
jgi:holo-[acyl-carrier protein] synthase